MLDPFKIREEVKSINRLRAAARPHDSLARARVARMIFDLYRKVLLEVARGSLDARSLAIAALEVEDA